MAWDLTTLHNVREYVADTGGNMKARCSCGGLHDVLNKEIRGIGTEGVISIVEKGTLDLGWSACGVKSCDHLHTMFAEPGGTAFPPPYVGGSY